MGKPFYFLLQLGMAKLFVIQPYFAPFYFAQGFEEQVGATKGKNSTFNIRNSVFYPPIRHPLHAVRYALRTSSLNWFPLCS